MRTFVAPRLEIPICFRACFQAILYKSISESNFGRLGLKSPGFRMETIATNILSEFVLMDLCAFLYFVFEGLGNSCSGFRCPGNRLEN